MNKLTRRLDALERQSRQQVEQGYMMTLAQWRHHYRTGEIDASKPGMADWLIDQERRMAWVAQVMADFEEPIE